MNKRLTGVRAYVMDKDRLKDLSLELSNIQKDKVTTPEIIRRTLNVPNIKDILIQDALNKRRLKKFG